MDDFNLALGENLDLVMIDVCTAEELEEKGVIDTGDLTFIHIALRDFITKKADWLNDKDADIVVYCGSGPRSTMATAILAVHGYSNVSSLKGGFGGWVDAGYAQAEYEPIAP